MVDAEFDRTPTAHVHANLTADYPAITARYRAVPTAHVNAELSTTEPGP